METLDARLMATPIDTYKILTGTNVYVDVDTKCKCTLMFEHDVAQMCVRHTRKSERTR